MHGLRQILAAVLLLAGPLAAEDFRITAEPDWVEVLPVPDSDVPLRAEAEDGQFFLLSDHQLRWEGEVRHSYARTVTEATDRAGLEEMATLRIEYDPEFDQPNLVRLMIYRDGQVIDLKDKVSPQIYRRETRLDEGIIDGALTAVIQVPDLRVGDVLDQASYYVQKPALPGVGRSATSWLEWATPVVLSRVLVHWPEGEPLEVAPLPDRVAYSVRPDGTGQLRHDWRRENHIPPVAEEAVPYEVIEDALLRLSDVGDWTPVVRAIAPHYTRDYPLPAEWEARIDRIMRDHAAPEDRAYAALRLVQEELRYVSLSVGTGGYLARAPAEVIASGFGDCKDKSLLLRVILDRLGIDSAVALADLDAGYGLPSELPMLQAFDHMILRATLGGKAVWMDPTGSHEGGGLGSAAEPDYGYALPVRATGPAALEPMVVTPEGVWQRKVREEFRFTFFGAFLTVETVHLSGAADAMRATTATTPLSQLSREYLDFYRGTYPGLSELRPPEIQDDRAANRIVVTERYFLSNAALAENGLQQDFVFQTGGMVSDLPETLQGSRRLPLFIGGPWTASHHIAVRNSPIEFDPPEDLTLSNPAFDFSFDARAETGGNMDLAWGFTSKVRSVPSDQAAQVIEDAARLREVSWFSWDLTPE